MLNPDFMTQEEIDEIAAIEAEEAQSLPPATSAPTDIFANVRVPVKSVGSPGEMEIVVKTFTTAAEIAQATRIDPTDVDNSLIRIAAQFARFSVLAAQARLQKDTFASRLELLEAKLDKAYRDEAAKKEEKTTEAKISQQIRRNEKYIEVNLQLNEAKAVQTVIEGAVEAIKLKRDSLVQLNKNAQAEWDMTTTRVPKGVSTEDLKVRLAEVRKAAFADKK